jgi:mRNA interferase RelE/StbE
LKVAYRNRFLKDLARIPREQRTRIEQFAFEVLPAAASVAATGNLERMTGFPGFYKARFGSYRVGARLEGDLLTLERVLDRKEIYRKFP